MQTHQQKRIAASVKKSRIRVGLYLWHDLPPHLTHGFNLRKSGAGFWASLRSARPLCTVGGSHASTHQQRATLQALAVGLARWGQRDAFHHKKSCRTHVIGQQNRKLCADARQLKLCVALRQQIGLKRRVFANASHPHDCLRYAPAAPKRRLDLAKLDAEAANFHLIVVASKVFNAAVGQPAPQIARAVHAAAGHKGISHKPLGGQVGPVHIAPCHLHA